MKRTILGMALALLLGALALAGCGGSSGGSSTETSTTASAGSGSEGATTEGKSGGAFAISAEAKACLKEKGVELPEMKSGQGGRPPGSESGEMAPGAAPPSSGEAPEGGEMPEGGPPAGAVGGEQSKEMEKAFEECGVETPRFNAGPGGEGGAPNINSAAFKKQVKEYVACVREHGYEIAEPNFSGEGPVFEKSESESAAFKKASAQCSNLLGGLQRSRSG